LGEGRSPIFVQSLVVEDAATGLHEVHVCVGGPSVALEAALPGCLDQVMARHVPDPRFGGHIRFVVLEELTPLSADDRTQLEGAVRALRQASADRGRPLDLGLVFSGDPTS
jgi:hypothetical protein